MKTKKCKHKRKTLRVLHIFCTIEVTAVFCEKCGKQLTKEKWEVGA
ncbi:hypothetical protein ACI75Y_07075 [Capnocytophaga stomatis]